MSDLILFGVLRMPPELWRNDEIDIAQRHTRYVEAADRITELEAEVERLEAALNTLYAEWMRIEKKLGIEGKQP